MNKRTSLLPVIVVLLAVAAGCGGGGGGGSTTAPPLVAQPTASAATGATTSGSATIFVPNRSTSSTARKAAYVSPSAMSLQIQAGNGTPQTTANIAPTSPLCVAGSGGRTCTVPLASVAGTVTFTFTAYDGAGATGNILGTGSASTTVVVNQPFSVSVVLNSVVVSVMLSVATAPPATPTPSPSPTPSLGPGGTPITANPSSLTFYGTGSANAATVALSQTSNTAGTFNVSSANSTCVLGGTVNASASASITGTTLTVTPNTPGTCTIVVAGTQSALVSIPVSITSSSLTPQARRNALATPAPTPTPPPLIGGTGSTIGVMVTALDADMNPITGPGNYTQPITLSDSDASGATTLSPLTVTGPNTTATLIYSGGTISAGSVAIGATVSGATAPSATLVFTAISNAVAFSPASLTFYGVGSANAQTVTVSQPGNTKFSLVSAGSTCLQGGTGVGTASASIAGSSMTVTPTTPGACVLIVSGAGGQTSTLNVSITTSSLQAQ